MDVQVYFANYYSASSLETPLTDKPLYSYIIIA